MRIYVCVMRVTMSHHHTGINLVPPALPIRTIRMSVTATAAAGAMNPTCLVVAHLTIGTLTYLTGCLLIVGGRGVVFQAEEAVGIISPGMNAKRCGVIVCPVKWSLPRDLGLGTNPTSAHVVVRRNKYCIENFSPKYKHKISKNKILKNSQILFIIVKIKINI